MVPGEEAGVGFFAGVFLSGGVFPAGEEVEGVPALVFHFGEEFGVFLEDIFEFLDRGEVVDVESDGA